MPRPRRVFSISSPLPLARPRSRRSPSKTKRSSPARRCSTKSAACGSRQQSRSPRHPLRSSTPTRFCGEPPNLDHLPPEPREWAALRVSRPSADRPEFHGVSGPPPKPRVWSVSGIETYLDCPFKFFARYVLKLDEEPEDEEVMDPRRQGQFVHAVFEDFFRVWQESGQGAITPANLDEARRLFESVVDRQLEAATFSEAEAGLERTPSSRVAGCVRPWRGGVQDGSRASRPRRRAAARVHRGRKSDGEYARGRSHRRASRQGRPSRSAGRWHLPPHRLQAGMAAGSRARAATAPLCVVCRTAARESPRPAVRARGGRVSRLQGSAAGRSVVQFARPACAT